MHFSIFCCQNCTWSRIASGGQGKESEVQATFSGRRTANLDWDKKMSLAGAKLGLIEIRGLGYPWPCLAERV